MASWARGLLDLLQLVDGSLDSWSLGTALAGGFGSPTPAQTASRALPECCRWPHLGAQRAPHGPQTAPRGFQMASSTELFSKHTYIEAYLSSLSLLSLSLSLSSLSLLSLRFSLLSLRACVYVRRRSVPRSRALHEVRCPDASRAGMQGSGTSKRSLDGKPVLSPHYGGYTTRAVRNRGLAQRLLLLLLNVVVVP